MALPINPKTDQQIHDLLIRVQLAVDGLSATDLDLIQEVRACYKGGLPVELRARAVNLIKRYESKLR